MLNPYEPPKNDVRYLSFARRLHRGLSCAWREYRAGLIRENFTPGQHIHAWLSLFCVAFIFFLASLVAIAILLWMLGIVEL